ncbi:hypothetical protein [Streptomyces sp. NPDC004065]|uniref:hypothetical protein n=1 Tax=Streptomyces sp. NPDC004065 TaxID=3364689 RepID=UPI00384C386B
MARAARGAARVVANVARRTEAEDLATRTNAAMETARSQKDAADAFTSQLAQVALEDKRIGEDTDELAAEAGRPGADRPAGPGPTPRPSPPRAARWRCGR